MLVPYTYEYPRPAVTVDCLVLTFDGEQLWVLLIQRHHEPFAGSWALPGGFIDIDEPLETAAQRELREETGLQINELRQFRAFGAPGRDPRGRTVAVVFFGFCPWEKREVQGGDDARQASWFPWDRVPPLAFDHAQIVTDFRQFLRLQAQVIPIGRNLLPRKFPRGELLNLYHNLLGNTEEAKAAVDRLEKQGVIVPDGSLSVGSQKAQKLYRFDLRRYRLGEKLGLVTGHLSAKKSTPK
ncbi:MAG: NUDIX hydrolase [Thermoguttaceae bacterium]|nr:NUDIX hydrolase [Thermoguttaceae bacterium]MDW8079557.1 NUDIX hydrolase [Thermoguttaceae bacterium]